ncbi:uncharacterized protein LOC136075354 [Hydra vulgaris]|uniref:Uncharacterized protein LOC136075354 n=1 Tax=Hydra vulgaris TaxID=6087 RepID=A0ABM4B638_HYDVU
MKGVSLLGSHIRLHVKKFIENTLSKDQTAKNEPEILQAQEELTKIKEDYITETVQRNKVITYPVKIEKQLVISSEGSDLSKSCMINNNDGHGILNSLRHLKSVNAIMGIYEELGGSKLYD